MAAETELQGTIILDADTTLAEKDVEAFEKATQQGTSAPGGGDSSSVPSGGGGDGGDAPGRTQPSFKDFKGFKDFLGSIRKAIAPILKFTGVIAGLSLGFAVFINKLAQSSGLLSAALVRFRIDVFLMTKQLGDELAPVIRGLVSELSELFRLILPAVIFGLKLLVRGITAIVGIINSFAFLLPDFSSGGVSGGFSLSSFVPALNPLLKVGVKIAELLKKADDREEQKDKSDKSADGFKDLFDFIGRSEAESQKIRDEMQNKTREASAASNASFQRGVKFLPLSLRAPVTALRALR